MVHASTVRVVALVLCVFAAGLWSQLTEAQQAAWLSAPPGSLGATGKCPDAGRWLLLYWGGPPTPIVSAATTCPEADSFWSNQQGRWLGFSTTSPQASDTWMVQAGEAGFVHGRSQQVQPTPVLAPTVQPMPGTSTTSGCPPNCTLADFLGVWFHPRRMVIEVFPDASFLVVAFSTRACQEDPTPPCDPITNGLRMPSLRAAGIFMGNVGLLADGVVTRSNAQEFLPVNGAVSFVLLGNGVAFFAVPGRGATYVCRQEVLAVTPLCNE